MNVKMEVTFDRDEVEEAMKREYERQFGKPKEGYELHAVLKSYGEVEVCALRSQPTEDASELVTAED